MAFTMPTDDSDDEFEDVEVEFEREFELAAAVAATDDPAATLFSVCFIAAAPAPFAAAALLTSNGNAEVNFKWGSFDDVDDDPPAFAAADDEADEDNADDLAPLDTAAACCCNAKVTAAPAAGEVFFKRED